MNTQPTTKSLVATAPGSSAPRWRQILHGEAAGEARTLIRSLTEALLDPESRAADPATLAESASLAGGLAGTACLFGYLARTTGDRQAAGAARTLLARSFAAVSKTDMDYSLYSGFTGVAWAAEHLRRLFPEWIDPQANEAVDTLLSGPPPVLEQSRDFDLIKGLVGVGVYALERLPGPAAVRILRFVLARLEALAEGNRGPWHTAPELLLDRTREEHPEGHHDLGLAHGVPGVIAFLALAAAAPIEGNPAPRLLDKGVSWLLERQLPKGSPSCFPFTKEPGRTPIPARLAWCYGDPGIAAALLLAARCTGRADWEQKAVAVALKAARRFPETSGVVDPGLCHGAAGLAHIFNRLYQATGLDELAEASTFWFRRLFDMRRPGTGVAGFSAMELDENDQETWQPERGLLEGATGVALTLLAGISEVEPEWDRMLLVSVRPR